MTPEQENELVAKCMGKPGDWRNDKELLWELACRIASTHRGEWILRLPSVQYRSVDEFHMQPFTVDFAEAVFAAAVMQAEQEGE